MLMPLCIRMSALGLRNTPRYLYVRLFIASTTADINNDVSVTCVTGKWLKKVAY